MLDVKVIKDNPEFVKEALGRRNKDYSAEIDKVIGLYDKRREIIGEAEAMKAEQNAVSKKIPIMKKAGEDTAPVFKRMKELSDSVKEKDTELRDIEQQLNDAILLLPNIPNTKVPNGRDSADNTEIRKWSAPREFDFTPKPHWEIGEADISTRRPPQVTGAFPFLQGRGARLERSIISFLTRILKTAIRKYRRIWLTAPR